MILFRTRVTCNRFFFSAGLRSATATAILNANYMMKRLEPFYPVFFK